MNSDNLYYKYFIEHPKSVGENYFSHGLKASIFGGKLICFGIFELIHAIIPGIDIFELLGTHSYIELGKLSEELSSRKNK